MTTLPDIASIDPQVRDSLSNPQYTQFIKELYYLAIYDIDNARVVENTIPLSIGPASAVGDNLAAEYYFRLPPKVHELSEPFATSITMTQDGGKYIESQGSPIKEIRLSGTTGLRPHRNDKKSLKVFGLDTGVRGTGLGLAEFLGLNNSPDLVGTAKSIADTIRKPSPWNSGEALGYDDITFLRNLFRLYAWHKENSPKASSIIMLWRNIKDGEYWLVEPKEFKLSQNSSSPLTYEYSITLTTITKWDYKVILKPDPMQFLRDTRNLYARTQQTVAVLKQSFLFIASQIDRFARLPKNIADFILSPMLAVIEGAQAVKQSSKRFSDVFTSNMRQLKRNLKEYLGLVKDKFPPQSEEVNSIRKAYRATETLLVDPEFSNNVNKTAIDNKASITEAYRGNSLVNSSVTSQNLGTSMAKSVVGVGDDIRSLAYKLLGDRTKYHVLVSCNSLQAPYISSAGGVGILKPGDEILYPVNSTRNNIPTAAKDSQDSISSLDRQFGRDLKLVTSYTSVLGESLDLKVSQTGDLDTVVGIANISQAVKLKFSIQRGELPVHPLFGALFPLGTKATPASLVGLRVGVEQTLLSDLRIASIKSLSFLTAGDVLAVQASIVLANSASSIKLGFPIRT